MPERRKIDKGDEAPLVLLILSMSSRIRTLHFTNQDQLERTLAF